MTQTLTVQSNQRDEFVDITAQVTQVVTDSAVDDGLCTVYIPHTTAAVTIQENADPDVARDIIVALQRLAPEREAGDYRHVEENAPAHVKVALLGSSATVPVSRGRLLLGTWQAIFLVDFDGPRKRQVIVHVK